MDSKNKNEILGYTPLFTTDEKSKNALYETLVEKGIPLFSTKEAAESFGEVMSSSLNILYGLVVEVEAVTIWKV